jgi:hypothetical protein
MSLKEFKCNICKKQYKSYQSLWKHNKLFHKNENSKKTSIDYNTILTSGNSNINNKFICQYCNSSFSRKNNMNYHIKNKCKQKNNIIEENKLLKESIKILTLKKNNNKQENNITTIKNDIKKITETYPINNQLINIIMDKNKTIEELKNNNLTSNILCHTKSEDIISKIEPCEDNSNISKTLTLNNVNIISRPEDNYINATQLCQAGNKKFSHWILLDSTKELINKLDNIINNQCNPETGIPVSGAVQISLLDVNNKNNQDSWIHPKLAIQLAQWISPDFALQVSDWIINLFTNGNVELNIKLLKEKENEIKLLRDMCMKKQKRINYPEKNVIYILTTEDHKKRRMYIIGKAEILKNRLGSYNKSVEHEVVYYKECKSKEHMNVVELMVLLKLDEYREKANRDRFILPIEKDISLFTSMIEQCIIFYN